MADSENNNLTGASAKFNAALKELLGSKEKAIAGLEKEITTLISELEPVLKTLESNINSLTIT